MKKAFTLVEIMVSVGLMSILAIGVNTYFISSLRSARKAATNAIVKSEGEQIQTNIVQMVKFAKRINVCTATSLSILANDGSDVTYSVVSNRLSQNIIPPVPTPTVMANLNSTKTSVLGCGGTTFTCVTGGRTVDLCFILSSVGAGDVTDATSMTFRNYIYTSN